MGANSDDSSQAKGPWTHVFIDQMNDVIVHEVPGLRGIVVVPPKGQQVNVTPTGTGVRVGGRQTDATVKARKPVGVEVPWMEGTDRKLVEFTGSPLMVKSE